MPNRSDHFLVRGVLSIQATMEVDSEYESQDIRNEGPFTVEFEFKPGYAPSASAFRVYTFVGDEDNRSMAEAQRSAAQIVIESDDPNADGTDALTDITVANYSTLSSFLSEAFSPSVPGSGGSLEMGNYTATLPAASVITYYYSLLCIIQDTLNHP